MKVKIVNEIHVFLSNYAQHSNLMHLNQYISIKTRYNLKLNISHDHTTIIRGHENVSKIRI